MIAKPSEEGNCTNWFMPNATESLGWTAGGGRDLGAAIPPSAEDLRERILSTAAFLSAAGVFAAWREKFCICWLCESRAASPWATMPRSLLRFM